MAPADRFVASATSVLSGLAFDFDFLGVSVPPKKQIYVLLKMGMLYPFD